MVHPERLTVPLRWKKPRRIFVNSMSDLFHESIPDRFIDQVFAVMALANHHIFQVLTKRPERMRDYMHNASRQLRVGSQMDQPNWIKLSTGRVYDRFPEPWPLKNIWLGVSVENQETADERIPFLMQTPAGVRWLSCEPLLGPIDLELDEIDIALEPGGCGPNENILGRIDWIVVGGESGPRARPMHPDWAKFIRHQCNAQGVPFFFKQWGEWIALPIGECIGKRKATSVTHRDDTEIMIRVGKKTAGRELDGRTHDEYPA